MSTISTALFPVFLIILLGYSFVRTDFPGQAFWPLLEKMTYFVLFPVLLVHHLSTAPLRSLAIAPMAGALISALLVMSIFLIGVRSWFPIDGPTFTSLFQGSIRFNGYVGLAIAVSLNPQSGLTLGALALGAMVPLINVLCVVVLAHYAAHEPPHWRSILLALGRNPLILGCLIGIFLNWSRCPVPSILQQAMEILGRAALPFGLLAVGAGLHFSHFRKNMWSLLTSVTMKLILLPILTWLTCRVFQVHPQAMTIAILFTALPTATSSYILARQMGGDYTLMASIITLQTILAMVTLPLMLTFLT